MNPFAQIMICHQTKAGPPRFLSSNGAGMPKLVSRSNDVNAMRRMMFRNERILAGE
jgi:hypothetical protein